MANQSKLHRPGRGRPPRITWRDLRIEWYDRSKGKVITTTAVCKGYRSDETDLRWEFVDGNGNTVVIRRSGLPRTD